jgi:hypothetical protein
VTLPPATGFENFQIAVKKTTGDANAVTVARSGAETIDGATSQSIAGANGGEAYFSDGANWYRLPAGVTGGGTGGAPVDAAYVVMTNTPALSNERALAVSQQISKTDGGANSTVTLGHKVSGVTAATYTNATVAVDDEGHVTAASSGSAGATAGEETITIIADQTNLTLDAAKNVHRLNPNASGWTVSGFTGGAAGGAHELLNVSAFDLIVKEETNSGATAANKIKFPALAGVDMVIRPGDSWHIVYDNTTARWRLLAGHEEYLKDPEFVAEYADDFCGGDTTNTNIGETNWWGYTAGGGTLDNSLAVYTDEAKIGVIGLNVGASGDKAAIYKEQYGYMGAGAIVMDARVRVGPLATSTDDYQFNFGMPGEHGYYTTAQIQGLYLRYRRASSANWQVVCDDGTEASGSGGTNVAVTVNTWVRLRLIVRTDHLTVEGFVDGVSVGTVTTHIPGIAGGRPHPGCFGLYGTAGNPSVQYLVDSSRFRIIRTARR